MGAGETLEFGETILPYWLQGKQYTYDYASRCMHRKGYGSQFVCVSVCMSVTPISQR